MRSRAEIVKLENELRDFQWQLHAQAYCHAEQYAEAREQSRLAEYARAMEVARRATEPKIEYASGSKYDKVCKQCDHQFFTDRATQIFCCYECSRAFHNSLRNNRRKYNFKSKTMETRVCPICGQAFETKHSRKMYCSDACYGKAKNRKDRERYARNKEVC